MHADLTYDKAVSDREKVLIKGRFFKADVFITRSEGRRFVVKDYSQKGFWERNLVGRIVISREARAYAALNGVDGLPQRFKRLSPFSFAVEFLEGRDLGAVERGEIGPDVIRQFEKIVRDLHGRGWVHLDLHRRTNILLVNGKVYVVDLASALHSGSIPLLGRALTALIGIADLLSLIKMKTIYGPELMSPRERTWLKIRNFFMPTKW
jgi:tRNA A-37 threonylcarbamoyl transferase component Bud32